MSEMEKPSCYPQASVDPDRGSEEQPLDQLTVAELFRLALQGDGDDESSWASIHELRLRGTDEVFDAAMAHVNSPDPNSRVRGLDVLAQLGAGRPDSERPHLRESVSIATRHLSDPDSSVVQSAAWALAHLESEKGSQALLNLRQHPDADVRQAVAFGLGGSNERGSIEALIELSTDVSDDVRDWATFGLGTQCDADSPEIRTALTERLKDPVEDVRNEALWGLVRRKDKASVGILLERTKSGHWSGGDEQAARDAAESWSDASIDEVCAVLRRLQD